MSTEDNDELNCPICCTDYTTKVRKIVNCSGCKKNICLICTKKYLLSVSLSPHCMHCKREFTSDWIDNIFSKCFRENQLRKHRITLLMEQEKSMFPHTLEVIENDELMRLCTKLIFEQETILKSISPRQDTQINTDFLENLNRKRAELKTIYERMEERNIRLKEKKETKAARKCPDCSGGFLNSLYQCYHCKVQICSTCFCKKDAAHICNENDVASYKLLITETKPCPKCSSRIQKAEGCNQMWCTSCNTAFNWSTLEIINGRIHNPHYQEYLNRNQIENNTDWRDQFENNEIPFHFPYDNSYSVSNEIKKHIKHVHVENYISNIAHKIVSIISFMIQRSHNGELKNVSYSVNLYENLRKQIIKKQLTEKRWFSILSTKETIREREKKYAQLDELIISIARDLFRLALNSKHDSSEKLDKNLFLPLEKARLYYNEQYLRLCKEYEIRNCNEFSRFSKPVQINENWYLTATYN